MFYPFMANKDERYFIEITKKLESFKNAQEWPDFIALLTSLDSTIQTYSLPFIPKVEFLCKRLNQCLNPLLPAGVHKKVLETYSIIFDTISEDELLENFGIYTLGLLKFGCHSRILVISTYLDLLEKYIIVLGEKIDCFTINVLYGILPAIESEASECYDKGIELIKKFRVEIDEKKFYNSLWMIFLQNKDLRQSIILFLMNEKINYDTMISDKLLVIKALKEGLKSDDLLILRGTLNLILHMFPLKEKIFSESMNSDLLEGMFLIFGKREQSLNKKVFSWINIAEDDEFTDIKIVTKTLLRILKTRRLTSQFFKIFTTLSDKVKLTEKILEDLLFEVLVYSKNYIDDNIEEYTILERDKPLNQQNLIDISKIFVTTDLDKLWKVFYLELKNSITSTKQVKLSKKDYLPNICLRNKTEENESISKIIFPESQNTVYTSQSRGFNEEKQNEIEKYKDEKKLEADSYDSHKDLSFKILKSVDSPDASGEMYGKERLPSDDLEITKSLQGNFNDLQKLEGNFNDLQKLEGNFNDLQKLEGNFNDLEENFSDLNLANNLTSDNISETSKNDISFDLKFPLEENKSSINLNDSSLVLEDHLNDSNYGINENISKKNNKRKDKKKSKETKAIKSPTDVLSVVNFCIKNYLVFDNAVLSTHLPLLLIFVLENYMYFDEEVRYEFLSKNITKIIFTEQSSKTCNNFFELVDEFYVQENASVLKDIESCYMSLISKYLLRYLNDANYCLILDFYTNFKENNILQDFVQPYFNWMIKQSLDVMQKSICFYEDVNTVNGDILFKELWTRFINEEQDNEKSYGDVWNVYNENYNSLFNLSQTTISCRSESLESDILILNNCDMSQDNKKQIVILIYEYNRIFKQRYERILIKKVNDLNKQHICLFLYFVMELQADNSLYFYNIFYLINNKISNRDPILISLLKSIYIFKGIFSFIIDRFINSNVRTLNYIFIDRPNISQIKGILKLIENCLFNSQKFRLELVSEYYCVNVQELTEVIGSFMPAYKNVLFDILIYIFLCDISYIKDSKYYDLHESIRNIKIQCIKMIQFMIQSEIIIKNDILTVDYNKILTICEKYKNDPAIIISIGELLKLRDDTNIIMQYIAFINSKCFYYFDFLTIIFSLDIKQLIIILPHILDNLTEEGYSFLIANEIINKMLDCNSINFNWAFIAKMMIQKFINFYNVTYVKPNKEDNKGIARFDFHFQNQKVKAISKISELFFNTFSGYFIEYLISSTFSPQYIINLSFKDRLYGEILSSYSINQSKAFKFLLKFDSICLNVGLLEFFKKYKLTLYQIVNYRTFTDVNTLLYLLKLFSILPDEHNQFLTIIYQTIMHMQRGNLSKSDKIILIEFLSHLEYNVKIKSALQTFLGFLFDLLKTSDKSMKVFIIDILIILSENPTITIQSMKLQLLEYLGSNEFFTFKLKEKGFLYKKLLNSDLNIMDELVYKLESSFFVSQVSDINNKCNVLKRIAFLIFSNNFNQFAGFNSKFIEMCVGLLQHISIKVRKQAWFLVKILCVKIDHGKLLPLFPVIFTEILTFIKTNSLDNPEYLFIVKLLDVLFFLDSNETFEFKNICLGTEISQRSYDSTDNFNGTKSKSLPLFYKLYKKLVKNNAEPTFNRRQILTKRTLFFSYKTVKSEDMLKFVKYCPYFYKMQDIKSSVNDIDVLEKLIVSEFHD